MAERKLKVFLDSNVFLSGLFSEKGAPRLILDILSLGLPPLAAVTGAYNIAEVKGRAFGSPLARGLYPRASTAEVDPRAKPGAPAAVERNLRAKLPEALPVFQSCLSAMKIEIVPIPSAEDLKPWAGTTADKDLPVLISAIQAKADVLVTGDKKDLLKIRNRVLPLTIASPGEFLNEILPRFLKG